MEWSDAYTVTLISTGVSAVVSFGVARYTMERNDYQRNIERLCERIEVVSAKAENYWMSSGSNPSLERAITSQFQYISNDICDLHKWLMGRNGVEDKLIDFRQQATGGGFQEAMRPAEPGRTGNIRQCSESLRSAIKLCKPKFFI